jgi:UDP-glucose 4-epimerase
VRWGRRLGDPRCLIAEATKSAELLGWRLQHSTLADGLELEDEIFRALMPGEFLISYT